MVGFSGGENFCCGKAQSSTLTFSGRDEKRPSWVWLIFFHRRAREKGNTNRKIVQKNQRERGFGKKRRD